MRFFRFQIYFMIFNQKREQYRIKICNELRLNAAACEAWEKMDEDLLGNLSGVLEEREFLGAKLTTTYANRIASKVIFKFIFLMFFDRKLAGDFLLAGFSLTKMSGFFPARAA